MPVLGFPSALDTEDDFRGDTGALFASNACSAAVVISASSWRSAEEVPNEDTRRTMMMKVNGCWRRRRCTGRSS
jgi:hypothetical protein